jgi:hypothetical protein
MLGLVEKACQGQAAWRGRHDIQHKDVRYNDTQHLRPDLRHMAYDTQHYNNYAECRNLYVVMLNAVMLSVVMLNVVARRANILAYFAKKYKIVANSSVIQLKGGLYER